MKSCFLIGHREADERLLPRLDLEIEQLIIEEQVRFFYVGGYGGFDQIAATAVKKAKKKYPDVTLMLVLPYHPAERPAEKPLGYDGTYYPEGLEKTPRPFAIVKANQIRNDIPVLAFIMDETQCPVLPIYVDLDEKAVKLKTFKQRLKDTKYAAMFISKDDLRNRIALAVKNHFEDDNNKCVKKHNDANEKKYLEGAKLYRKFLLVPERLKNTEVLLRIRMDGQFANNFIRRDELFDAYQLKKGDTVVAESVIPVGIDYSDINNDAAYLDLYAEGKHADWIIDNGITTGVIFEGRFKLVYELIEGVAHNKANSKPFASKIPALILIEGLSVIGKSNDEGYSIKRNTGWESLFEG